MSLSELELAHILFAIAALLMSAHAFGYLAQQSKIPRVIGEIFGGLLLGPTCLGALWPQAYAWLFTAFPSEPNLIALLSWLGLILLMCISGTELQHAFSGRDQKLVLGVLIGGTLIPFAAGWIFPSIVNVTPLLGSANNLFSLKIVLSIAVSVTSIPVISKIFIDLGIMKTRFAKIVVATAAIEDVFLWIALALATGLVSSAEFSLQDVGRVVGMTAIFLFGGVVILPHIYPKLIRSPWNFLAQSSPLAQTLFTTVSFTALASVLKVNAIFGALIAGYIIGQQHDEASQQGKETLRQFALAFLIPLYFAVVGLKLNLLHQFSLWFFVIFCGFAMACKVIGTLFTARLLKQNWLSSLNLSMAMNARGGPGIVLATVAYELGIISEVFFSTLILLAIFTSLLAGYWFRFVLSRGWELLKE